MQCNSTEFVRPACQQLGHRPYRVCSGFHQRPLFLLHCEMDFSSHAEMEMPQAQTVASDWGRIGLLAAVSRIAAILPNDLAPTNMNGPLPTLALPPGCCGRSPHCRHSPRAQNLVVGELTVCGRNRHSNRPVLSTLASKAPLAEQVNSSARRLPYIPQGKRPPHVSQTGQHSPEASLGEYRG